MDSYVEVSAEALLLINGAKNAVGFGFTYGFLPWTVSAGYETVSRRRWTHQQILFVRLILSVRSSVQ